MGIRAGVMRVYQSLFWRQKTKTTCLHLQMVFSPSVILIKQDTKREKRSHMVLMDIAPKYFLYKSLHLSKMPLSRRVFIKINNPSKFIIKIKNLLENIHKMKSILCKKNTTFAEIKKLH